MTGTIASLHQENPDPPSKNRVGGFEVVTYSCTRVIRPQALEPHQETYTTTTTTVSDVVEWLSKDPIGINDGLNQYVAFGNNPMMFVDPEGEAIIEAGIVVKGIIIVGKYVKYKAIPAIVAFGAKKGPELVERAKPVAERTSLLLHKWNHDFHFGMRGRDQFVRNVAGVGDALWVPSQAAGPGYNLSGQMAYQYKYAANYTKLIKDGAIPLLYWLSNVDWPSLPTGPHPGPSPEYWGHANIVHRASSAMDQECE